MKTVYYLLAIVLILLLIIVFLIFKIKKDAAHYHYLTAQSISTLNNNFTDTTCMKCPQSGPYNSLEFDDASDHHINDWNRVVRTGRLTYDDGTPDQATFNLADVNNVTGLFVSKEDLMQMICKMPDDKGFGVAIKLGISGDGSAPDKPRKLMPYVSGAKMTVSISSGTTTTEILPFDLTNYATHGVPGDSWQN